MVVGLWNAQGDLSKVKTRIGGGATTHVVATLAEAQEQVRLLIQPLLRCTEQQVQPESGSRVVEAALPVKQQDPERVFTQTVSATTELVVRTGRNHQE